MNSSQGWYSILYALQYLLHYVVLVWGWGEGRETVGTGGRVPGMTRAHPQFFRGRKGWGQQLYIYFKKLEFTINICSFF